MEKLMKILNKVFQDNVSQDKEIEVRALIVSFIEGAVLPNEEYKNLDISLYIKDKKKKNWLNNKHYTITFDEELEYAQEKYNVTDSEAAFLQSVRKFCAWELNLLMDGNNNPLNQQQLAELLHIHPRTVQRNMDSLIEKKLVYGIDLVTERFYIINPFIMYKGSKISKILEKLFIDFGYVSKCTSKKLKKETVRKRTKVSISEESTKTSMSV
jgi:hypothetical protein